LIRFVRIIFVNRFYWPDEPATAQLLTDLAEALAAKGLPVEVIASRPSSGSVPACETRNGVKIRRITGTRWGRRSLAGRVVDFATFLWGTCWRLAWTAERGDVVVALTDPPLLGLALSAVCWVKSARCLHWVQDVYPEVAATLSASSGVRLLSRPLRRLRNLSWQGSAGCVALGRDMAGLIARAGVEPGRIAIIPNWAPAGVEPPPAAAALAFRRKWGLEGEFVALYSGNLGRVHDLVPVLSAAEHLRDNPDIVFLFIGGGAQRAVLEQFARDHGLGNVRFGPAQPRRDLPAALAVGDIHFVTLHPGCAALVFPSKLYGIAAVGRPVLFIGPEASEIAGLVRAQGMGYAFHRGESAAIAAALRELAQAPAVAQRLGDRAAAFSRREGRLEHAAETWERILREAAC
jgi:glycosyltransferase involved in cell wall biosynthesis